MGLSGRTKLGVTFQQVSIMMGLSGHETAALDAAPSLLVSSVWRTAATATHWAPPSDGPALTAGQGAGAE